MSFINIKRKGQSLFYDRLAALAQAKTKTTNTKSGQRERWLLVAELKRIKSKELSTANYNEGRFSCWPYKYILPTCYTFLLILKI